eukprot:TRINITY_DN3065_c0_g1_i5.p1 TRINITY_DN3065_c0_g1~~TRINITY_DN3065_c0_g1_i5.p1  ORF type:complete len:578 (-),score=150.02 TRINITY_DN3065_c0_g1_i5:1565-3298(-)
MASKGEFFSYACGVAYEIATKYKVRGIVIENYLTDLPIAKGLSSSAAICVMVARAFNRVYDLKLTVQGEMDIAYHGEVRTPSRCGRMDQCCAFGNRLVLMTFDGDTIETKEIRPLALRKHPLYLVLVDLHAAKDTKEILAGLSQAYPFPKSPIYQGVQDLLGPINKRILHEVVDALENPEKGVKRVGELMLEAQENFDRYATPACPSQLTAPKLHTVLRHAAVQPLIYGCKGVGSQGDGTAQFVCKSAQDQQRVVEILERDFDVSCLKLEIGGSSGVQKAVIPAAGFASALFPASKIVKTPLFPIVDHDGIAKPAILLVIEEALSAGISEIAVIVQSHDLAEFKSFFQDLIPVNHFNSLPQKLKDYHNRILEIGQKITFIVQDVQDGFGHAVLCAQNFVNNEPFLLLLGDHIYRSKADSSCASQLVSSYSGTSILGMQVITEEQFSMMGVVGADWQLSTLVDDQKGQPQVNTFTVKEFAEKPTAEYARGRLVSHGQQGEEQFFGVFGQYVLNPTVFGYIEQAVKTNHREHGVFGLTNALEGLRANEGFEAILVDGVRFDIGNPVSYMKTIHEFPMKH